MSDYLSEEEQLARMRSWWERHGNITLLGLVIVLVVVVGWRWMAQRNQSQIEASSILYEEFINAKDEARVELFTQLESSFPDTSYLTFALMHNAKQALAENEVDQAKQYLERAAVQAPDDLLADLANLRLARVLQQLQQSDAALQALAKVRGEGNRARVAELKGDIHLSQGDLALAHESYQAGLEALGDDEQRSILEMKAINTANSYGI